MKTTSLIVIFFVFYFSLFAQKSDSIKSYTTARVTGEPPQIDGKLNDPAWEQVPWGGGDFIQRMPDSGKPASVQTKFKILYDSKNLYLAFKNYDPEPDKIVKRMSRRDGFEGDFVEINIDSYNDKRTAFSFTASVSGVKGDEYISNNGDDWDENWDPIWYLKTSIDSEGWIAEFRIPLSQLRFADKPELIWGFQVQRNFFRKQEMSNFQYIPADAGGWVHLFAELNGISGIKPQKQLEIQPYVLAKTETFQKAEGNPFLTGSASTIDGGLDAKIGITSDITLDLTVNPDFGQVEADPSQVNLSAFELFFQEQRPFFIEGSNTLSFPTSDFSGNNLYYSRRIGRAPQGYPDSDMSGDDDVDEYAKADSRTTILGAAKLTGKNKNGFSWGILESVTAKETAEIDSLGYRRRMTIEPLTNYLVARMQQDIKKGNTIIGGIVSAVNRRIDDKNLEWLHTDAYSGGVDLIHNWMNRTYYVSAKAFASHVMGSPEAILNTQRSSERFFQRPDNNHATVDPTRTSMTGSGGSLKVGKKAGKIVGDLGLGWSSPGLELNDIGFLPQTDNINQVLWIGYKVINPTKYFRYQRYNVNEWLEWDFDGKNTGHGYNVNAHVQFKNYWSLSAGSTYQVQSASNADLRGGPALRYPGFVNYWMFASTDQRKKLYMVINPEFQRGLNNYSNYSSWNADIVYRPFNALNIALSPSLTFSDNQLQYVATGETDGNERYIVASIDQTTLRVSIRATYMLTPNLSLQYYGQPFGTAGKYNDYKYITEPSSEVYTDRFASVPDGSLSYNGDDGMFEVDEDQDGNVEYSFYKPDFNFGQFRSNMVLRWEYIPGSTVFLVWTQEKNGAFYASDPDHKNYSFDFNQKPHNIFLIKFTYRFVL